MATRMYVLWFRFHKKLHNTRKNILKLAGEDATLDKICKNLGHIE